MENFSPDSRIAIKSCLKHYRKLNSKILEKEMSAEHRYSLTLKEKLSFLPVSKLWKLILLYT